MVSFISAGQMTRLGNHSLHNTVTSIDIASLMDGENDRLAVAESLNSDFNSLHVSQPAQADKTQGGMEEACYVTFKALPVEAAWLRRDSRSYEEPSDDLSGVSSCKEAVDLIVEAIRRACEDIGNDRADLIKTSEIVRQVLILSRYLFLRLYLNCFV